MTVKHYTRFVALVKRSLWALIIVVIGVLVWIASDTNGNSKARIVFSNIAKSAVLQDIMLKPHYQGVDSRNRPYTVIAEKATQLDPDDIFLEKVHADMVMNNGVWVAMNSGTGILNSKTKLLVLHDGVDMFYENGYEFRADHANVDIAKGTAYADTPVEGQGTTGTIQADGFSAEDHGQILHFNGSVKVKLYR